MNQRAHKLVLGVVTLLSIASFAPQKTNAQLQLPALITAPTFFTQATTTESFEEISEVLPIEIQKKLFRKPNVYAQLSADYKKTKEGIESKFLVLPHVKKQEQKELESSFLYIAKSTLIESGDLSKDYFLEEKQKELVPHENIKDTRSESTQLTPNLLHNGKAVNTDAQKEIFLENPDTSTTLTEAIKNSALHFVNNISNFFTLRTAKAQEETSLSRAVNYLLSSQNSDNSWGNNEILKFPSTVGVINTLHTSGAGTSTQAVQGIDWLSYSISQNTVYFAEKINTLALAGQDVSDKISTLASYVNELSGGFSFNDMFEPDPYTTAKVLITLHSANYEDEGENPNYTVSAGLYYLLQTQRSGGGWSDTEDGVMSIPATVYAIKALLPYKNATIIGAGSTDMPVAPALNNALSSLKNIQQNNGSWNNNIFETSIAASILKDAATKPLYETEIKNYIESQQLPNGSFSNNPLITAYATEALLKTQQTTGNLVVNSITPSSSLITGEYMSLAVSVTNEGSLPVSNGILHVFTDDVLFISYDFSQANIFIQPNETRTIFITTTAGGTWGFVNDVKFTLFFEGVESIHPNSWFSTNLFFTTNPSGYAGTPVYFIAQQNNQNGQPALNVRWKQKTDPARLGYYIMYRLKGQTAWNFVSIPDSWNGAFLYGGFVEGSTYEVTVASVSQDGTQHTYFNNYVDVRVSADPALYNATISGTVYDSGEPKSGMRLFSYNVHTIFTNEEGDFSQSGIANGSTALWADNAPYEALVSTFHSPAGGSVNDIKVFTRLIPDSAPPQITNFSFFGSINNTIYNKRSYTLFVGTTDTIGIESASFYYKVPNSSEWVLIGSSPSYNRIEAILSWYIPETFIGSGYQFKTVVRDFQGNMSEAILNSLVIQEGNAAPTIQLLAPNEAEITVDTSLTIVWEDEDIDNNARINILYDTDNIPGSATIIHSDISEDSPVDQYVWDTTHMPAGNYYVAISITDDFNNHVWSYAEHPITIFHSTVIDPPPPPPQNIPPTITITNPDGFVDIANLKFVIKWSALDPDDNALIDVYYDTNNFGEDGVLIANNLFENTATSTEWNTSQIPANKYYIYAKIRDNINTPVTTYGAYPVQVRRGGK